MTRRLISSGGPWEDVVGYSRAVRVGDSVFVAGTTSAEPDGAIFGGDDGYLQAKRCFEIIERALHQAGAGMRHVVRTRMFVTDIRRWEEFSKAHGEVFRDIKPAATMVQVSALMAPGMLIEIEVDAVVDD
ncbi:MAG: RidA family protein [Dehalococcoidia bacterium]|jgi:enamine deaminase RidA (YjgF/YER057c/UK114 family)|uniref:RidA family protein n=1 Tax=Candidatus Amarobacter glycogenicus TaxID=3140699 RepID=UPI002A0DE7F5|nr:RidA family protein [Dehalococcoidia bacterium]MBK7126179.1 RidA family protein [Dehalococcoidia bacterium]MBK9546419.1 RidA family protein [Dehalococcoidia bacterium]MBK9612828.1 RidA family protein [Dehalococcoidia bacterium]